MTERLVLDQENIATTPSRPRETFYVADDSIELPVDFERVINEATKPTRERAVAHGHDHSHDHGHGHSHSHSHAPVGIASATYEPGKKLTPKERNAKFREGLWWSTLAAGALVIDAFVHATPGTGDDVVFHGLAAILLGAAGRGFNSYWRGHDMPGSEVNVSQVMSEFWSCWKRNGIRNIFKFMTEAADILHEHVPQPVAREAYKGEGNPVSSVTYARENLFYNRYEETEGPLRGSRKRFFSGLVLASTAVAYTVGSALREAVITNLHESGEFTEKNFGLEPGTAKHWFATMGVSILVAPVRAVYGFFDGAGRYVDEFRAGRKGKKFAQPSRAVPT